MPPAAAAPEKKAEGSGQNDGFDPYNPTAAKDIARIAQYVPLNQPTAIKPAVARRHATIGGKSEILVHAQRGKADVCAIHVGYEIDHHDQGRRRHDTFAMVRCSSVRSMALLPGS